MPNYFYHIGIELFNIDSTLPTDLSQTFRALNPFTSHRARASRDHKYDSMRKSASFSLPSGLSNVIPSSSDDLRIDEVIVQATDITAGIGTKFASSQTKAVFAATEETEAGERGIVHLYRDAEETPGLYQTRDRVPSADLWNGSAPARSRPSGGQASPAKDEDCILLSILAVPSYMTPRDFLAFVGQDTRHAVSHFRMIRTSRLNRYMVLMKFKDGRFARQWQSDWNGKLFNNMEPETCHVVFVKSVEVLRNQDLKDARAGTDASVNIYTSRASLGHPNKPLAPPTPSLIELPTCPVCLERMDESTGLITNLCQHVFHCTCLEKWSGYGCPVCRFKDDSFSTGVTRSGKSKKHLNSTGEYEVIDEELVCHECRIAQSLWQCLICGIVGCGRYAGKHAYRHFEKTGHTFSLDLESQRVWDYDHDCYVHRIIANGSSTNEEKLVELPGRRRDGQITALEDGEEDLDVAKRENLAFEYTQLLTSQLESQRIYFEDQLTKAVDNKTKALQQAEKDAKHGTEAHSQLEEKLTELKEWQEKHEQARKVAERSETKARTLGIEKSELQKKYEEVKALSDTISENFKNTEQKESAKRNQIISEQAESIKKLKDEVATKNFYLESLQEQIVDLRMQVSAKAKLQAMVASGQLTQDEVDGSTISAGPSRYKDGTPSVPSSSRRHKTLATTPQAPQTEPTDTQVQASLDNTSAASVDTVFVAECLNALRDLELCKGKTADDFRAAVLQAGVAQPRAEEGLYESDGEVLDQTDGGKSKAKKKKRKNKKK